MTRRFCGTRRFPQTSESPSLTISIRANFSTGLHVVFYSLLKSSPIGDLLLAADETGLRSIQFLPAPPTSQRSVLPADGEFNDKALSDAREQLQAYFQRRLRSFQLPLAPVGTQFQSAVWNALQQVPWGYTASYSQIASAVGNPRACRAVGLANGRNPIPIIIPCHRIIGSSQRLVGYAGGLHRKRTLLAIEGQTQLFDLDKWT